MERAIGTPARLVLDGDGQTLNLTPYTLNPKPQGPESEHGSGSREKRLETRFTADFSWAGFEGAVHGWFMDGSWRSLGGYWRFLEAIGGLLASIFGETMTLAKR
ncbi:MAG: hypothetical protein LBT62_01580 [Deltaproteobacteria bacterium]|nr:hypothetical protein [Deltaproteobacteria bacterium]